MAVRVLIVDDSSFFRRRLSRMLGEDPRLSVAGVAGDGAQAVEQARALRPDVITMDVEMPVMNGIEAVRRIMSQRPTPVLMFSSLTYEGARATLEALEAGALDFMPKQLDAASDGGAQAARRLCDRLYELGRQGARVLARAPAAPAPRTPASRAAILSRAARRSYSLIAIGTSTGGPVALQRVLAALPAEFPVPLLLVQHMPAGFTQAFAGRLDQLCAISVREARDGDRLLPGQALLAPGGRQTLVRRSGEALMLQVRESTPAERYRPCIDLSFASAGQALPGRVLAVVLTGMGADGREGARALKQAGSAIWAQDQATSVVYGMPMAVAQAGLADQVLSLDDIGAHLSHAR